MTIKAIALDQATVKTGWCFGSPSLPLIEWKSGKFSAPKRDEEGEKLIIIEDSVLALIDQFNPDVLIYESPVDPTVHAIRAAAAGKPMDVRFSAKTMQKLQRVKAAIIMAAARRSIPTEEYQPRSWQAFFKLPSSKPIGAPDNWKKRAVMAALKQMGFKPESLDESDAIGLCFYALHGKAGVKRATDDLFEKGRARL